MKAASTMIIIFTDFCLERWAVRPPLSPSVPPLDPQPGSRSFRTMRPQHTITTMKGRANMRTDTTELYTKKSSKSSGLVVSQQSRSFSVSLAKEITDYDCLVPLNATTTQKQTGVMKERNKKCKFVNLQVSCSFKFVPLTHPEIRCATEIDSQLYKTL